MLAATRIAKMTTFEQLVDEATGASIVRVGQVVTDQTPFRKVSSFAPRRRLGSRIRHAAECLGRG